MFKKIIPQSCSNQTKTLQEIINNLNNINFNINHQQYKLYNNYSNNMDVYGF